MKYLKDLIMKWLLGGYLKKLLDLLPLNGKKTVLCALLTCLLVLVSQGTASPVDLQIVIDFLKDAGATPALNSTEIGTLVGCVATVIALLHKALKFLDAVE